MWLRTGASSAVLCTSDCSLSPSGSPLPRLPMCECGAPLVPEALLFDEDYESHECFRREYGAMHAVAAPCRGVLRLRCGARLRARRTPDRPRARLAGFRRRFDGSRRQTPSSLWAPPSRSTLLTKRSLYTPPYHLIRATAMTRTVVCEKECIEWGCVRAQIGRRGQRPMYNLNLEPE